MNYVLGIDIGTGSSKAVALQSGSEPILVSQIHYPVHTLKPGYNEQDPDVIWKAFQECLQSSVGKLQAGPDSICLSSAMHSLIPVDEHGHKLADMMTWADSRSNQVALRLKKSADSEAIYKISGMPLHAMSPLCKIIWIRENDPELFARTYKFVSIKEYIWFKLFNEFCVDYSIAGSSGMFDLETLGWSPKILDIAGISEKQLSSTVNTSYFRQGIGSLSQVLTGFSEDLNFVIGASDGCLANLGSFALDNSTAALTVGTSGAVRIASPQPIIDPGQATFSYFLNDQNFICGGAVNNGGNVLQWYLRNFMDAIDETQSYQNYFSTISEVPAGSEGLWFLPYLNGERAPIWDSESCGNFFGIRSNHAQRHFSRAVLEGICFALNDVLLAVEKHTSGIKQLNVSGGFVNSKVWMQMLADVTGKRISLQHTEDASAIGAAFMAANASGKALECYFIRLENQQIIQPDMENHVLYKKNFLVFKQLYASLKDTMHQIHQNS